MKFILRLLSGSTFLNFAPCKNEILYHNPAVRFIQLRHVVFVSFIFCSLYHFEIVISSHFHVAIMSGMDGLHWLGLSFSGHLRREGPMKLKKLKKIVGWDLKWFLPLDSGRHSQIERWKNRRTRNESSKSCSLDLQIAIQEAKGKLEEEGGIAWLHRLFYSQSK